MLKDASSMKIDFSNSQIEFINFKYTRTLNVEQADIEINFSFSNKRFDLILEGCSKSKYTWLLGVKIRIVIDFKSEIQSRNCCA